MYQGDLKHWLQSQISNTSVYSTKQSFLDKIQGVRYRGETQSQVSDNLLEQVIK